MAIANKTFPPLLGPLVFQAEDSINLTVKFIISFQIQL